MKRKIVPDIVKPREVISASPDDTLIDAAAKMVDAHIAALIVTDDKDNLVGIVTERDMTPPGRGQGTGHPHHHRVRNHDRKPGHPVPGRFRHGGLDMMHSRHFRHLPVVDGTKVICMVSIRTFSRR